MSARRGLGASGAGAIYLVAGLALPRFDDAIAVFNHLLDNDLVDAPTAHGLRLGRAMAMLREDHLFDADRALADLRRTVAAAGVESAGLALVEIYRDVKTGHPGEAVAIFEQRLPALRDQLGHRVADAYALAARRTTCSAAPPGQEPIQSTLRPVNRAARRYTKWRNWPVGTSRRRLRGGA